MDLKGHKALIGITLLAAASALAFGACLNLAPERRKALPHIVWPKPPEIPRIRFVNSISRPEDLQITAGVFKRFIRYMAGEIETSITSPYGVTTDSSGRLYVVDTFLGLVHVFDVTKTRYYSFPSGDTTLLSPIGIAIDEKKGRIYISDSKAGRVKIFGRGGREFVGEIGKGALKRPTGIAINEKTSELLVVDTLGALIYRYVLSHHKVKGTFGGRGKEKGRLHYPTNIWVTGDGHILVSDSLNFRVQVFSAGGRFLSTFGSAGDGPGYFSRPRGVASDSDGNIYVVDALFDNVQIFNREGRLLMAFGGPGKGYGAFWLPSGIFIDRNDTIYVSDSYNKRVQVFQYVKRGGSLP
jgi:DNA-binding beta-propeller fold protein YncE